MSPLSRSAFLVQLFCTLSMTGIIWFVQVVHYPLFLQARHSDFVQYEAAHATRTGWVVGPLMCLELAASACLLLQQFRPSTVSAASAWLGTLLVGVIWVSTAFVQVPLHRQLAGGLDADAVGILIRTNWIRTIAWTIRSLLVLTWTSRLMKLKS